MELTERLRSVQSLTTPFIDNVKQCPFSHYSRDKHPKGFLISPQGNNKIGKKAIEQKEISNGEQYEEHQCEKKTILKL